MAKKHGGGHGGGSEERWLLTYADLITLLLAFFIILWAGSRADLEKFGRLAKALSQAFGVSVFEGEGGGVLGTGSGLFEFSQLSGAQRQFMHISEKLQQYASQEGLSESIAVNFRNEGIVITLSNALLFPSGGVEIGEESRGTLAEIAELIRPLPNEVRIEAHTDNLPTNSPVYPTNWELSAARAAAVVRYLIDTEGIEASRLSALGYGEQRSIYANDTREHRLLNRRADILILYPNEKTAPIVNVIGNYPNQEKK
ncbi:MAG: OmpA family protein [Anaerolineae bacterium]|nr:OmpA family protein [Anaerolineae bacterium]